MAKGKLPKMGNAMVPRRSPGGQITARPGAHTAVKRAAGKPTPKPKGYGY